jgi:uncharacterized membrane protein
MMLGMAVFWLAIIVGLVWLVRDGLAQREQEPPTENALAILDRRLAEGTISPDEHKQCRDVLNSAGTRKPTKSHLVSERSQR